jgi:hypothetical protein
MPDRLVDDPGYDKSLVGRSLTFREYGEACFRWLDRRIALHGRMMQPDYRDGYEDPSDTLDREIAWTELRQMLSRVGKGESWEAIRRSAREGLPRDHPAWARGRKSARSPRA